MASRRKASASGREDVQGRGPGAAGGAGDSAAPDEESNVDSPAAAASGEDGALGSMAVSVNGERSRAGQPMIDLDFLRGLIAAVDKSTIDSLEISRAGTKIRIAKTPPIGQAAPGHAPAVPSPGAPAELAAPAAPAAAAVIAPAEVEAPAEPETTLIDVKSPMVGTFYRAPAPEAPPYVEVGAEVSVGQTLCILEAMKLMNELESEVNGTIREVLVENAEPVEYGQVLFRIEPRG